MSFKHGKLAEVWFGGLNLTPYTQAVDLSVDVDTADKSVCGVAYKSNEPGQASSSVSVKGVYDPTVSTLPDAIASATGPIVTYGPAGMAAVGDVCRLLDTDETSVKESSPVGGIVAFEAALTGDGTVGFGSVLRPLADATEDGTGTAVNNGAATTGGAIVHVHVTSMTGGDELVFTLQDSANGSAWLDVASGTFPTVTAAGGYRLVVPGTIRQYSRISWDIDANPVTFGAAIART